MIVDTDAWRNARICRSTCKIGRKKSKIFKTSIRNWRFGLITTQTITDGFHGKRVQLATLYAARYALSRTAFRAVGRLTHHFLRRRYLVCAVILFLYFFLFFFFVCCTKSIAVVVVVAPLCGRAVSYREPFELRRTHLRHEHRTSFLWRTSPPLSTTTRSPSVCFALHSECVSVVRSVLLYGIGTERPRMHRDTRHSQSKRATFVAWCFFFGTDGFQFVWRRYSMRENNVPLLFRSTTKQSKCWALFFSFFLFFGSYDILVVVFQEITPMGPVFLQTPCTAFCSKTAEFLLNRRNLCAIWL